jgi:hypothetical protein
MFLRTLRLLVLIALLEFQVIPKATVIAEITVSCEFPGGSAEVREINQTDHVISISPKIVVGRGWPCWWFLRMDGLPTGRRVTLKVHANPRAYREDLVLSSQWMQPDQAVVSCHAADRAQWYQTDPCERHDGVATYQIPATCSTMWAAWGVPFLTADVDLVLARVSGRLPESERFELARTRGGRSVPGIRIGGGTAAKPARLGVWVQARQHAWEVGGSWVGEGFIDWASGADADAVQLRETATIYYIPIMDVDNVEAGAGGKDAVPRDHNRDWSDLPVYPEVRAAQQRILSLDQEGLLDVFVDLHNPGASERQPYFFGPNQIEEMPAKQQQNYVSWQAIGQAQITGPLPLLQNYLFATYVKSPEESGRMSANWVRHHTSPHVLSTTLETAWNTPHSQPAGYRTVGRQLGQAVQRYLSENRRFSR